MSSRAETVFRPETVFRFLTEHRALVLAVHAILLVVALSGLRNLRADYSADQFFLFGGPEREVFDEFKSHFPRGDLQVSALLEVTGLFGLEEFSTLQRLAESFRAAGLDDVRWIGETEFFEETIEDGEPVVTFVRLADEVGSEAGLTEARLRSIVEARRDHPLFSGSLWNRDLTVFAVHGYLDPGENNDPRRRQLTRDLEAGIAEMPPGAGRIVLSGLPILRVTVPLALESDLVKLLGLGSLFSLAVLLVYFQRVRLVLLCFAAVLPAIVLTLGGMGLVGRQISVLTGSMPIVVLVVGISDATHLLVGTRRRWKEGLSVRDATVDTFSSLSSACFFTSLTTALGFLGLVATRIGVIVDFGVVTAIAVLLTYLVTLTLLPVLLTFATDLGPRESRADEWCRAIVRGVERTIHMRPGPVISIFAVCLFGGLLLGAGLRVNALLIDDLKPGDPILEDLRWIEESGYGLFQVNVFLNHGEQPAEHAGHSPEMLQWTEDLQSFAQSDPVVLGAMTLPEFVRELGVVAGLDPGSPEIGPFDARAGPHQWTVENVRELLFLAELQEEDALEGVYVREDGVAQMILYVRDGGSPLLIPFLRRLEERLEAVPPPSGTAAVTGTVKLNQVFWDQMIARLLPGVLLSVVLVWVSLAWMFRSVRLGLLALLPNLFPLAMLLGVMRLGGFDLKPSTAIVFSIAFGIVADDTIHFLGALASYRKRSLDLKTQLVEAVREVGPALILSTLVVCAGFSALTASRFQVLFLIGLLTAASAVFAVGADLIGFPALLRLVARRPGLRSLLQEKTP